MGKVNQEELDFESMTQDELKYFIDSGGDVKEPETKEEEPNQPSKEVEADETQEPVASEEQPAEVKEEEPAKEVSPRFSGKSTDDFIEMQLNADKKISQQGNEIYHLKKKLEEHTVRQKEAASASKTEAVNDLLSQYDGKDIEAFKTLIRAELNEVTSKSKAEQEKAKQSIAAEHDIMWKNLETFNPTLYASIKDDAMATMRNDLDSTFYKKGWMAGYIDTAMRNSASSKKEPTQTTGTIKRKANASTVNGQGAGSLNKAPQKDVNSMSSSEYKQYLESQGINIFTGR